MNALGMYILVSLFFVMSTMIELAIILVVKRTKCCIWSPAEYRPDKIESKFNLTGLIRNQNNASNNPENGTKSWCDDRKMKNEEEIWWKKSKKGLSVKISGRTILWTARIESKIDCVAFCVFLSLYVMFNIFYFVKYMN